MVKIQVLGSGCANCKQVEQTAKKAVAQLGIEAQINKVTDFNEITKMGVLTTPGLVINNQLVCSGRVPTMGEITSWIATALDTG